MSIYVATGIVIQLRCWGGNGGLILDCLGGFGCLHVGTSVLIRGRQWETWLKKTSRRQRGGTVWKKNGQTHMSKYQKQKKTREETCLSESLEERGPPSILGLRLILNLLFLRQGFTLYPSWPCTHCAAQSGLEVAAILLLHPRAVQDCERIHLLWFKPPPFTLLQQTWEANVLELVVWQEWFPACNFSVYTYCLMD